MEEKDRQIFFAANPELHKAIRLAASTQGKHISDLLSEIIEPGIRKILKTANIPYPNPV